MPDNFDVSENSWYVWSKHVLMQLEKDTACLTDIKKELAEIKVEMARLKVKIGLFSGIWGAIGGAIPVAIALALWVIKK